MDVFKSRKSEVLQDLASKPTSSNDKNFGCFELFNCLLPRNEMLFCERTCVAKDAVQIFPNCMSASRRPVVKGMHYHRALDSVPFVKLVILKEKVAPLLRADDDERAFGTLYFV